MMNIICNGFVGNAVHQNLKDKIECKLFDIDFKLPVDESESN